MCKGEGGGGWLNTTCARSRVYTEYIQTMPFFLTCLTRECCCNICMLCFIDRQTVWLDSLIFLKLVLEISKDWVRYMTEFSELCSIKSVSLLVFFTNTKFEHPIQYLLITVWLPRNFLIHKIMLLVVQAQTFYIYMLAAAIFVLCSNKAHGSQVFCKSECFFLSSQHDVWFWSIISTA